MTEFKRKWPTPLENSSEELMHAREFHGDAGVYGVMLKYADSFHGSVARGGYLLATCALTHQEGQAWTNPPIDKRVAKHGGIETHGERLYGRRIAVLTYSTKQKDDGLLQVGIVKRRSGGEWRYNLSTEKHDLIDKPVIVGEAGLDVLFLANIGWYLASSCPDKAQHPRVISSKSMPNRDLRSKFVKTEDRKAALVNGSLEFTSWEELRPESSDFFIAGFPDGENNDNLQSLLPFQFQSLIPDLEPTYKAAYAHLTNTALALGSTATPRY